MINNLFLGIETSCDDTCISIFNNRYGVISEYVFTQLIHIKYGGTVPELASKDHLNKIFNIIFFVLKKKKINIFDIKIIAYTKGPGLKGSLFIGASVAKSLSLFLNIPAISINHLEAHILISFAFNKIKQLPALVLLISGANTILLKMFNYNNYIIIGETLDDGVGETFDKIARSINLIPPNGISIEKNMKYKFIYNNLNIGKTLKNINNFNFSFSGLKSEILRLQNKKNYIDKINLIYNFQNTIINIFIIKIRHLLTKDISIKSIILGGGVSANKELRLAFLNLSEEFNILLNYLPKKYCTDNATMIVFLGFIKIYNGYFDKNLEINIDSSLRLF